MKRKFSYDEICDIVLPVASQCHLDKVCIMPPKSKFRKDRWTFVDIIYYPGLEFDKEDEHRMESLYAAFPVGQFSLYKVDTPSYWRSNNDGIPVSFNRL